jgi:predicted DNA-binding protein with PD1-like motif
MSPRYAFDGYNWLVRFDKGDLLVEGLTQLVRDENIQGAWVSGLGAALWAELGYYDLDKQAYEWKKLDGPLEIASIQGTVAWEGEEPVLHLHGTLADRQLRAFGGHIKELQVAGTCEILLHRWYADTLRRVSSPPAQLKPLDL